MIRSRSRRSRRRLPIQCSAIAFARAARTGVRMMRLSAWVNTRKCSAGGEVWNEDRPQFEGGPRPVLSAGRFRAAPCRSNSRIGQHERHAARPRGTGVTDDRRQGQRDRADEDFIRRAASWLRNDPRRTAGLASDKDAAALANLLDILATELPHLHPEVRRRQLPTAARRAGRGSPGPAGWLRTPAQTILTPIEGRLCVGGRQTNRAIKRDRFDGGKPERGHETGGPGSRRHPSIRHRRPRSGAGIGTNHWSVSVNPVGPSLLPDGLGP